MTATTTFASFFSKFRNELTHGDITPGFSERVKRQLNKFHVKQDLATGHQLLNALIECINTFKAEQIGTKLSFVEDPEQKNILVTFFEELFRGVDERMTGYFESLREQDKMDVPHEKAKKILEDLREKRILDLTE